MREGNAAKPVVELGATRRFLDRNRPPELDRRVERRDARAGCPRKERGRLDDGDDRFIVG